MHARVVIAFARRGAAPVIEITASVSTSMHTKQLGTFTVTSASELITRGQTDVVASNVPSLRERRSANQTARK